MKENHKTWILDLNLTISQIRNLADNVKYAEHELLLTACYHYLKEYEGALEGRKKRGEDF